MSNMNIDHSIRADWTGLAGDVVAAIHAANRAKFGSAPMSVPTCPYPTADDTIPGDTYPAGDEWGNW